MTNDRVLKTARTMAFCPAAIYNAFASGQTLAEWWGPDGFTNTFDTFEFVPNGRWVFTMHGPDGSSNPNTSYFETLERDQLVVIRHDCLPYFTLTVGLTEVAGGTQLVWEQAFDDAQTAQALRAICEPANEQNLDRLTAILQHLADVA